MKKRVVKKSISKKVVSASSLQSLRLLAEQLGEIIPATSMNKTGFCFTTLAKEYKLKKYWENKGQKKESIASFLVLVYKKHPRVLKKLIRENLSRAIERRHKNGNPILRQEADTLSATLFKLNIDLKKEIGELDLPTTRPSIVPPRIEIQKALGVLSLHPMLLPDCKKLFDDGHLNESVRKALEKYEVYVRDSSGLTLMGTNLMEQAFSEKGPKISISNDTDARRNEGLQTGFKDISRGAMEYWRNYSSHGDEEQMPAQDAISILGVVSHLLYIVQKSKETTV
jgi:uncharacterized protein (TIGR02391 family)